MNWQLSPKIPKNIRLLLSEYDDLTAQLLFNRGVDNQSQAKEFFEDEFIDVGNAKNLKDIEKAVTRIINAVKNKEKIVIYGDYDVDGVCSSSILFDVLYRCLGADVIPYVPSRFEEGYGLNEKAIKQLVQGGRELLVTVDCGVRDGQLLKKLSKENIDFIVTDHHELPQSQEDIDALLESTVAVVHPFLSEDFSFKQICATTVVWYLVVELVSTAKKEKLLKKEIDVTKYLDLVALATVCDIMPLVENNRILLKVGLKQIQETVNLGLKELLIHAGVFSSEIDTYHLGYVIGPRLNAPGRLDSALDSVRLLVSKDRQVVSGLAKRLSDLNSERQTLTKEYLLEAEKKLLEWGVEKKLIFIVGENWPEGIVGLVAGRLNEKYHKPVIVASLNDSGLAVGSARSIKAFHITNAISKSSDILERFGGHAQAAGFSVSKENIEEFSKNLLKEAKKLSEVELEKKLLIEAKLKPEMLTLETLENINKFAPFGFGNKQPLCILENVQLIRKTIMGKSNEHIKLFVKFGKENLEIVGFNKADFYSNMKEGESFDLVGFLMKNNFMNETRLQLNLIDFRIHVK